jgi:hypothetical protein
MKKKKKKKKKRVRAEGAENLARASPATQLRIADCGLRIEDYRRSKPS